ncbi:MAG: hypothetical protein QF535_19125 [Anaerolineales bacterium]|nr:hypothetical protein [Anaerolineales bacterium]
MQNGSNWVLSCDTRNNGHVRGILPEVPKRRGKRIFRGPVKGLKGAMNGVTASGILNLSAKHQETASEIYVRSQHFTMSKYGTGYERDYGLGSV